jgi:hypothetical protein
MALTLISLLIYTEKRQEESERIREKYPDRVPVRFLLLFWIAFFP